MRKFYWFAACALSFVIGLGSDTAHAGQSIYAIGDGGASLVKFDSANPGSASSVAFTGAASFLDSIDFRTADGKLYGYLDATDSIYNVNLDTGELSFVSQLSVPTNTFVLGIDFNPTADRLRIVTDSQQNLRTVLATGATTKDGDLMYDAGDVNGGSPATLVAEAAYTNSNPLFSASTKLYYLDYGLDILATTTAPNAGTLTTVGNLGVDTSELIGFDIVTTNDGVNSAFALLTVGGLPGLYNINLTTGAASLVGQLPTGLGNLYSLAVAPVPEPSTLALAAAGAASFLFWRGRTRAQVRWSKV